MRTSSDVRNKSGKKSARALSEEERQRVLSVMHEDRFVDKPPSAIYATLLDEGIFLCSIRTMYRILKENDQVRERRNVLRHRNGVNPVNWYADVLERINELKTSELHQLLPQNWSKAARIVISLRVFFLGDQIGTTSATT
ncbi:hypothetical protein BH10CYA1_BH10CYA1_61840 [soil metagenome]